VTVKECNLSYRNTFHFPRREAAGNDKVNEQAEKEKYRVRKKDEK
jgi:hypothetical protein